MKVKQFFFVLTDQNFIKYWSVVNVTYIVYKMAYARKSTKYL